MARMCPCARCMTPATGVLNLVASVAARHKHACLRSNPAVAHYCEHRFWHVCSSHSPLCSASVAQELTTNVLLHISMHHIRYRFRSAANTAARGCNISAKHGKTAVHMARSAQIAVLPLKANLPLSGHLCPCHRVPRWKKTIRLAGLLQRPLRAGPWRMLQ